MTDRELLEQSLDAMEAAIKAGDWEVDGACDPDWVLNALRARLAQPEQEPYQKQLERLAAIAYEAGRKDENEAIAQMIEDAPPLVDFAKNEHGGCVICGFTPKLAAFTIRERMRHE